MSYDDQDKAQDEIPGSQDPPVRTELTESEETCPVCDRVLPESDSEICPHCSAPIQSIKNLMEVAGKTLVDAERDISTGDIANVGKKLDLVATVSKKHRINVELVRARLDNLLGDSESALKRLNAVADLDNLDRDTVTRIRKAYDFTYVSQERLASCCEDYNFALYEAKRGHLESALESLKKGLGEVPYHAQTHALLGKVYLALRDENNARYHLIRAIEIDPRNSTAAHSLSLIDKSGNESFVEFLRSGKKLAPNILGWAGSIIVILILAILAIGALFSR
jgi:tetratricopeptide (TPR) repeat protein